MTPTRRFLDALGITVKGESNGEVNAYCPKCEHGKTEGDAHLYVNPKGLWHCKKCNAKGNDFAFVALVRYGAANGNLSREQTAEVMKVLVAHGLREDRRCQRPGWPSLTIAELAKAKAITEPSLRRLGAQEMNRGVAFPMVDGRGDLTGYRVRWPGGKQITFGPAKGRRAKLGLLVPDGLDKSKPIILCEGETDAARALDAGLNAMASPGAGQVKADDAAFFRGLEVLIVPDLDTPGQKGAERIARLLYGIAKEIRIVRLPGEIKPDHGDDLRDFFNGGASREDFEALAQDARPFGLDGDSRVLALPYREQDGGIVWVKTGRDGGEEIVKLTNCVARIVGDIVEDDGVEERRQFDMEARLNGRAARFTIPSSQFGSLNWLTEKLGAAAFVYPGFGARDHARVAIQQLSGDIPRRMIFAHTGWRELPGQGWCYLHAGGAIGPAGEVPGVEVHLPEALARFCLPSPPSGDGLRTAIQASLRLLDLAPREITFPIYAGIWRAALGGTDFTLYVAGQKEVGKTELAALAQSHWGAGLDARHLPGSWSSTANALEGLAFVAKDALLVVDDFCPSGSRTDIQRTHREADRLLRGQGNHSGRLRMRADASLHVAKPPRGTLLSTGEDLPRGQSLRARLVVLELSPGDLAKDRLTEAQRAAAAGLHAQAMAGFLRWTAGKLPPIGEDLRYYVEQYRNFLSSSEGLQRSSSNLANLAAGFGFFLAFAQGAGAIAESEAEDLWAGVWASFREVDAGQTRHLIANDPVLRFFELLSAAITAGHAHLADPEGKAPEAPAAWGWREHPVRSGWETRDEWQPQGDRIGWVEGGDVFLEPDAAYAAAQKLGAQGGENLYVTLATLTKRIAERSLLATRDADRSRNTIRRTFEGRRVTVLHIFGEAFHLQECPMPAEVSQPSQVSPEPSARNSGGRPDRPKWPRDCPTGNRNGEETSSELGQLGHQDRPLESLEVSRPPQNSTAVPHVAQSPELQEPQDALSRKGEAPGLA